MLKIKLSRTGKRGFAHYKIVVNEAKSKRDGQFVDIIGVYNPHQKSTNIKYDQKRLTHWLNQGAQPTDTVRRILKIK